MDLQPLQIDRTKQSSPARRSRGRWLGRLVALVVVGALVAVFWRPLEEQVDRLRLPEVRVLQVVVSSPLAAGAVQGTAANGYIVARTRAALSADTPGRIVEMNVTEGQSVPKGFVVARLYADEYRAVYERAEADLTLARTAVESSQAARGVAAAAVGQAQTRVRGAEADRRDGQAALELAELDLDRIEKLVQDRIVAQDRLDQARAQRTRAAARLEALEAAVAEAGEAARASELELALADSRQAEAEALVAVKAAERDQARATLDKTEVRAPFDGVIVLKDAEVGEVVSPNAVGSQSRGSVVTMVDPSTYEVQVELPETSLTAAVVGAPATIFIDAFPERPYPGRVLRIWPTANRTKATVELRVGFDQPDARLRAEMGARVVFAASESPDGAAPAEPAILIPRSAIVPIDGHSCVFVLERDVARVRTLELGEERGGRVVVRAGLASGERIVDSPPVELQDGDRVREEG